MSFLRTFLAALSLCCVAAAQQPNQAAATLTVNGLSGPTFPQRIALATSAASNTIELSIEGAPGQSFSLGYVSGAVQMAGLPTAAGLLDLDLQSMTFLLDGIGRSVGGLDLFATTGPQGASRWRLPGSGVGTGLLGSFQAAVADPASPLGFRLSGAAEIDLAPNLSVLHVSRSRGRAGATGNLQDPLATITAAYDIARATRAVYEIFVEAGVYAEQPDPEMNIDLIGGWDASFQSRTSTNPTEIVLQTGPMHIVGAGRLQTTWRGLWVRSAPAVTGVRPSAIALIAERTIRLSLYECRIEAEAGAHGGGGASGGSVAAGARGGDAHLFTPGMGAGGGGVGAPAVLVSTGLRPGLPGQAGSPSGGIAGLPGNLFMPGGAGGAGAAGSSGAAGVAPLSPTTLDASGYLPVNGGDGARGAAGRPGGGGGSGGCRVNTSGATAGGAGGGGGAGGSGGDPGLGGAGGGASIAILLVDADLSVQSCTIIARDGGNGGRGGSSGVGGAGGSGGAGGFPVVTQPNQAAPGGAGGRGGSGGCGGPGAGGGAGPSWSIAHVGTRGTIRLYFHNDLQFGAPGTPGAGGRCAASLSLRGATGLAAGSGRLSP